ncbi:lymphocyte antigen 6C1-like [Bufo gargarizans]|uniref:lymphocyte antigen 6C1-like n=1 Tax=Bufo gargarizans TaxID=30331 RepID=UPI001CF26BC8|nr:lymphocyte antigen 6C1-like [Bufo gargarizans]
MQIIQPVSLSILIFSVHTVNSLRCYSCENEKCESYKKEECPQSTGATCASAFFKIGDTERKLKGCIAEELCKGRPPFVPSNVDFTINCCNSNLCNSAITTKMSLFLAGFLALVSLCVSRF